MATSIKNVKEGGLMGDSYLDFLSANISNTSNDEREYKEKKVMFLQSQIGDLDEDIVRVGSVDDGLLLERLNKKKIDLENQIIVLNEEIQNIQ